MYIGKLQMEIDGIGYKDELYSYCDHIPVVKDEITYNDFFQTYLVRNQACIIKNVANNWDSYKTWTVNNNVSFDFLLSKYGDLNVTIYNCGEKHYNSQKTEDCMFKDYLNYWVEYKNDCNSKLPLLYLKDWHLRNCVADKFYEVPKYFLSDWLNEYLCENNQDDYRFVYMGPKGTWTPFHEDVFTSYSWSTNICGQKKWLLFPPGEENNLKDSLGNLPYNINNVDHNQVYFEVIQNPCDAIFVPSGWHHQVYNLTDTISINHNWINACNLLGVYRAMEKNLEDVKKEISDCQDMADFLEQSQIILEASFGMNFIKFYDFLLYIGSKRLKYFETLAKNVAHNKLCMNKNHVLFDLQSIYFTLKCFAQHADVTQLKEKNNLCYDDLLKNIEIQLKNCSC